MHKARLLPFHQCSAALLPLHCDTEFCNCMLIFDIVPCETYNLILKYCVTAGVWEGSFSGRKPKDDLLLSETDMETILETLLFVCLLKVFEHRHCACVRVCMWNIQGFFVSFLLGSSTAGLTVSNSVVHFGFFWLQDYLKATGFRR